MTARVIDCRTTRPAPSGRYNRKRTQPDSRTGLGASVLVALVVVPLAGAAEPPFGWTAAGCAAVLVLTLAAFGGSRVRWGWLATLTGLAGILVPRGPYGVIGPVLLVTCVLCGVLWFAGRGRRAQRWGRPETGSREHQAQQLAGLSGEVRVGQFLAHALPQEYALINGLKLPRGSGDIDHLVVGPSGLFVLETKTMAGLIVCEPDGTWRRTRIGRGGTPYSAFIGDPAAQVQRNIRALRECLRQRCPELLARTSVRIEGVVVFPHPRTELDAEHSRVTAARLEDTPALILGNVPRQPLQPGDVAMIVGALLEEVRQPQLQLLASIQSAQVLVEMALAVPVVLVLLFGTVALSRVLQAQSAVVAIAHEAARAGALGANSSDAVARMLARAELVSPGFGMDPRELTLDWDVSSFSADPGRVATTVRYRVDFSDLPVAGWLTATTVRAAHVEFVDPFRSGLDALDQVGR